MVLIYWMLFDTLYGGICSNLTSLATFHGSMFDYSSSCTACATLLCLTGYGIQSSKALLHHADGSTSYRQEQVSISGSHGCRQSIEYAVRKAGS